MTEGANPDGSDAVVEVEFRVTDEDYPLVALPRAEDCRLVLEKLLPHDGGLYAQYFSVIGTEPERVEQSLDGASQVESRLLMRYDEGGLFEFIVTEHCPACELARRGAVPTTVEGTAEYGRIVAELFPAECDPGEVVSWFLQEYSAELAAKRRKVDATPLVSEREVHDTVLERLTDRQREVLFAAYEAGYYERPRKTTGEELAAELGIAPATFQQHLRAAERKLVSLVAEYGPK